MTVVGNLVKASSERVGENQRPGKERDAQNDCEGAEDRRSLCANRLRSVTFHISRTDLALDRRHLFEHFFAGRFTQFGHNLAVGQIDNSIGVAGGDRIVGDHDDRLVELINAATQKAQHFGA